MVKHTVNKLDAARAQLDAAIELYFTTENPVATHTLVAAAYNLLRDVGHQTGTEYPFLKRSFLEDLSPHEKKSILNWIRAPENFFKHADRDASETLEFDPELTDLLLMDASHYFQETGEQAPKYLDAFKVWAGQPKEGIPRDSDLGQFVEKMRGMLKAEGKAKFWSLVKSFIDARS